MSDYVTDHKCPYCKKYLAETAYQCPQCGAYFGPDGPPLDPLSERAEKLAQSMAEWEEEKKKQEPKTTAILVLFPIGILCIILCIIGIYALFCLYVYNNFNPPSSFSEFILVFVALPGFVIAWLGLFLFMIVLGIFSLVF